LEIAKTTISGYKAATALQNEGILQMQKAGEQAKENARKAQEQVALLSKKRSSRTSQILASQTPVSCEESRQYAFELAKQLLEER
jgi:hypothetical protein